MKRILLTGTHLTPALATALELKTRRHQLLYVGRPNQIDPQVCQEHQIPFKPLLAPKVHRHLTLDQFRQLSLLPTGFFDAYKMIKSFQPDLILSFGGYLAFPLSLVAKAKGLPLIIHEQTASLGLANRLLSPLADKIALSYPPQLLSPKQVLVGNPIRPGIIRPDLRKVSPQLKSFISSHSRQAFIYVTGGHQGALFINHLVQGSLNRLSSDYLIIWQYGQQPLKTKSAKVYSSAWFNQDEVGYILQHSLFAISRSGANTITDLQACQLPAILIPLPKSAHQEQQANADYLSHHQAALVLKQNQLSSADFPDFINQFIESLPLYQQGIRSLSDKQIKNGAQKLADLVETYV